MEIKVKKYDERFGDSILIKDFSENDFLKFKAFLKSQKIQRLKDVEKRMFEYGGRIKGDWISESYDYLGFTYRPQEKIISIHLMDEKSDGKKLMDEFLKFSKTKI